MTVVLKILVRAASSKAPNTIMKREMYYGKKYKTKDELIKAIKEYIDYYTNKRVQRKLCVLTPQEYYEKQLLLVA